MSSEIAFITCVNEVELYEQCVEHIRHLKVPSGYQIAYYPVERAIGMASGYNSAMKQSKGRYKVYLHQDVHIIEPKFIQNIVNLFSKYPQLGLLGVVGAETLPSSGIWWESNGCYGKVHDGTHLLQFKEVVEEFKSAKAIDGLIMITQHDILWREDLFTGWHFYDVSQSLEFIKDGYEVGIPKQENHWCVHECGKVSMRNYNRYRRRLIKEYGQFLGRTDVK